MSLTTAIPEENIGYQLIKKMGWLAGTGLGRRCQGRVEPVSLIDKRERMGYDVAWYHFNWCVIFVADLSL